jgi:hypothetical protein
MAERRLGDGVFGGVFRDAAWYPEMGVFGWLDKRLGNGVLGVFWGLEMAWEEARKKKSLGRFRDVGIPTYPRDGSIWPQECLGEGLGIEFEACAQDCLFHPKYRRARKLARVAHGIPGLPEPHPSTQISTLTIVNP